MATKEAMARSAKVIAFYNFKGGVGKTTMAVNYAAWKAKDPKKRVLFIDMDSQCNSSSSFLGFDEEELEGDPAKYLSVLNIPGINIPEQGVSLKKVKPVELITQAPNFHLFAIKGSCSLDDYWTSDKRLNNQLDCMLDAIDELRPLFDCIVIDLGPRYNTPTLNAITAADYVVLPMTCEEQAIKGVEWYLKRIYPACSAVNPMLKNLGLVANRYKPSHVNIYSVDMADLAERYDTKLFSCRIRESLALSSLCNWDFIEKAKTGRCVCTYDKYIEKNFYNAYQDYLGLVLEIDNSIAEQEMRI